MGKESRCSGVIFLFACLLVDDQDDVSQAPRWGRRAEEEEDNAL